MTNGLNNKQYQVLNILAWVLLTILLGYGGWLGNRFYELRESLPQEYVRLERYTCDIQKLEKQLERINDKLNRMIEQPQNIE